MALACEYMALVCEYMDRMCEYMALVCEYMALACEYMALIRPPMMNNQTQVQQMVNSSHLVAAAATGRGSGVPPHMAPVQMQGQMPGEYH
jgi:hypothetical protein